MASLEEKELRFWKASPHQWGPGRTHMIDDEDAAKTLCGKHLASIPGQYVPAVECDCRGCVTVLEARQRRKQRQAQWEQEQREYLAQRTREKEQWQVWYENYLESPEWLSRREAVLEREDRLCQACRRRRATQVHHTTYTHVGHEPLFELVAICRECHESLTAIDQERRPE